MSSDPSPVFVERETYRRRRLVDAARMLPVLGVLLVCLPLLWTGDREVPASTTYLMIYVFGIWLALVVAAAFLSRNLVESEADDGTPEDTEEDGQGGAG